MMHLSIDSPNCTNNFFDASKQADCLYKVSDKAVCLFVVFYPLLQEHSSKLLDPYLIKKLYDSFRL